MDERHGTPDRTVAANLGDHLRIRFEQSGDHRALDEAIEVGARAAAAGPGDRVVGLVNLAAALRTARRHGRTAAIDRGPA